MIIRDRQIEALRPLGEAGYARSAADYLTRYDPVLSIAAGREALEQASRQGLEAARRHGLTSGPALQLYLEVMMSLGSGFDTDPQYRWLGPFLEQRKDVGPVERARFLHFHARAYLSRACGPERELARAALEKARDFLAKADSARVEAQPAEVLRWLHPEKADFVDPAALSSLLVAAQTAASSAGFPMPQGTNLLLILMFLFGAGVGSDPLLPWVGRALRGPDPGPERWRRLLADAQNHIATMLGGLSKEKTDGRSGKSRHHAAGR